MQLNMAQLARGQKMWGGIARGVGKVLGHNINVGQRSFNVGNMLQKGAAVGLGLKAASQAKHSYDKMRYGEYGGAALSAALGVAAGFAAHRTYMVQKPLQQLFQTNMAKMSGKLNAARGFQSGAGMGGKFR